MLTETPQSHHFKAQPRIIRVRTLVRLRWFAVIGQLVVTFVVRYGFGFELPLWPLIAAISVGVWTNLYVQLTRAPAKALTSNELAASLLFDTLQIACVLFLTGGIQNPFAVWLVMPAVLASAALDVSRIRLVVAGVVIALTVIAIVHEPLPWAAGEPYMWDQVYNLGTWLALMLAVTFTSIFAYQVANEQAKLSAALEATQSVLAREERLTAVGGLAAAAAHELGTPLATIQVTARELERELPEGSLKEDARLVFSQTQRCQRILERLSDPEEMSDALCAEFSLEEMLRDAARPFHEMGGAVIEFNFAPQSQAAPLNRLRKRAEVMYSIRTLIDNAYKHAASKVQIDAAWSDHLLTIAIEDDGIGFSDTALHHLGEPFSRPRYGLNQTGEKEGLGLGIFIAKTLLERTGATLVHGNRRRLVGAWVEITWPLENLRADPISNKTFATA